MTTQPADRAAIGPNLFASVMGTGIVATAAAVLPVHVPGLRMAARGVWLLAAVLLVVTTIATLRQWRRHPGTARAYANDPAMSPFYGAPPMALLTVGAGAVLVGKDLIGLRAAVDLDWVLWTLGTVAGLACSVTVPYLMFTRHRVGTDAAFGGWLMPVVPPMVSAATGALLVPHVTGRQAQLTLLFGCYALFGLSLLASIVTITLIWGRLAQHQVGAPALVPTLWIVLGPLGQSITAAGLLGNAAQHVLPAPYGAAAAAFALLYGVPVLGFAALWLALAIALTLRQLRLGMPFTLAWWSFTFPVGTCVTGVSGLAIRTGADVFTVLAGALFTGLVLAWATVFVRTLHRIIDGRLLRQPVVIAGPRLPGRADCAPPVPATAA